MHDRRLGFRVPFESMVTSYVRDRPVRAVAANLSDSGVSLSALSMLAPPPGLVVGLEIDLPGTTDSIWASGRICYRKDDALASGPNSVHMPEVRCLASNLGVRFIAMARAQAQLVRDFCIEMRRKHLGALLARIRA